VSIFDYIDFVKYIEYILKITAEYRVFSFSFVIHIPIVKKYSQVLY